jgi:xanthine dehydrogenase accessory factor
MTHSFEQDRFFVESLLPLGLPYVGMLGSRDRSEEILCELGADIVANGIYAPAGLDTGGETPEEIAVSITAEIRACLSKRSGGFLRDRSAPIHATDGATSPSSSPHPRTARRATADLCKV